MTDTGSHVTLRIHLMQTHTTFDTLSLYYSCYNPWPPTHLGSKDKLPNFQLLTKKELANANDTACAVVRVVASNQVNPQP